MQRALSGGWTEAVRPLVADYVDRLAAEIGSPPDLEAPRRSPSGCRCRSGSRAGGSQLGVATRRPSEPTRLSDHAQGRLTGSAAPTADGHRISSGWARPWERGPRSIGWTTLGALLLLTVLRLRLRAPPVAAAR